MRPQSTHATAGSQCGFLQWSHHGFSPTPQQSDFLDGVGGTRSGHLHLQRKQYDLGQHYAGHDGLSAKSGEEIFHGHVLKVVTASMMSAAILFRGSGVGTSIDHQSMRIFRSRLKSLNIFPVPSTTLASGSSATLTGRPVSS